ncbi:MAG: tetratricopeptide repeat protein [Phycisphaerales bacterium]|nr:tetratricopeptide repeat protein [Phycisphaerales bacterium]
MHSRCAAGRVNVRLLLIVASIAGLLVAGVLVGHQVRKNIIARNALAEGKAKLAAKDWLAAANQFKIYLSKYPDDQEILGEFAAAHMEVRPLKSENLAAAIAAHRRLIRLNSRAERSYAELALLYGTIGNYDELAYVARRKQEFFPGDPVATLWLANAFIGQGRRDEARDLLAKFVNEKRGLSVLPREYASACIQLSRIELESGSAAGLAQAREWLNRAMEQNADPGEALARRAQVFRLLSRSNPEDASLRTSATADLEKAGEIAGDDPRLRLLLSQEWADLGDYARARRELRSCDGISLERLRNFFIRVEDWRMLYFSHAVNLALRDGSAREAVALADDTLSLLKEPTQRAAVLPAAIELYAAADRVDRAEACLNEYREATALLHPTPALEEARALLEAIVLWEQGQALRVIDKLRIYEERDVTRPRVLKLLGQAYAKTSQPRRAIKALRLYLRQAGEDAAAALLLSRQYVLTQDWAAAMETARRAELRWTGELDAKLMRLEAALRGADNLSDAATRARVESVAAELDALRAENPQRAELHVMRAVIAEESGELTAAEGILRAALTLGGDTRLTEAALARVLIRGGKPDDAVNVCREVAEKSPDDARTWLLLGEALDAVGRPGEAIDALKYGVAQVSDAAGPSPISTRLAILEMEHDRRADGLQRLRELSKADTLNVDARSMLLDAPEIRRDNAETTRLIAEIRAAEGDAGLRWRTHQAAYWLSSGESWRVHQKEITELLTYCQEVDAGWSPNAMLLGGMHERLAAYAAAEAVYRRALAANPAAREVAERLLNLLETQQRFGEATQLLDQMEQSAPLGAERRAALLMGAGEWQQAVDLLRLRVANDEADTDARALLARLMFRQTRDVQRALRVLDSAKGDRNSEKLEFARIAILQAAGQIDSALQSLNRLVDAHPTFRNVAARAALLESTEQLEAAERDFRRLAHITNDESGVVLLGMFLTRRERLDEAIEAYRAGMEKLPGNPGIGARLIAALAARRADGDAAAAQRLLEQIAAGESEQPQVLWLRALLKKRERGADGKEIEQLLERVVELEPTHIEAHLGLIDAAMRRGDFAAARERCIRALGAAPNNPRLMTSRAQSEQALGNGAMAKELIRLAVRGDQPDADALTTWIDLARATSDAAMLSEGRALLDAAIARRGDDERLRRAHARCLDALGKPADALVALDQFMADHPTPSVELLLISSELANKVGDAGRVLRDLDAAAGLEPGNYKVLRARVMWHALRGEVGEVMKLTADLKPDSTEAAGVALLAATSLGDSPGAAAKKRGRELLESILAAQPGHADARLALARLAFKNGDTAFAEKQYQQVLASNPNHVRALNDYAWILATGMKRAAEALKLVDQALSIAPDQANLRDTRGEALLAFGGRESEARSEFERCAALAPKDSSQRAKALLKIARLSGAIPAEAVRCAADALAIDADSLAWHEDAAAQRWRLRAPGDDAVRALWMEFTPCPR